MAEPMVYRTEIYLARAAECEAAALAATDQKAKQLYTDLASQWRDLARRTELVERGQLDK
jgi:hypothetical protein